MSLEDIQRATRDYADARERLGASLQALQSHIESAKRGYMPELRKLLKRAAERKSALHGLIQQHPDDFKRPRTLVAHGIKVGFAKGKGRIEFGDADRVVALVEKYFPDQTETLINVKKTPVKDALAQLQAVDLKRLGVTVKEAGDQVVIKPVDSDLDKLVDALLGEATEEAGED